MKKQHVIKSLTDPGVVPVVRLNSGEKLPPLLEALADGGIRAVELTMTIPGATTLLRENCRRFEGTLLLGMGIRQFSMSAKSVGEIKYLLRKISLKQAVDLRNDVMALTRSRHVISRLRSFHYEIMQSK